MRLELYHREVRSFGHSQSTIIEKWKPHSNFLKTVSLQAIKIRVRKAHSSPIRDVRRGYPKTIQNETGLTKPSVALAPLHKSTNTHYPFRSYNRSYSQTLSQKDQLFTDAAERLKPWEISRALIAKRGYFSSFKISGGEFEDSFRSDFRTSVFIAADQDFMSGNSSIYLISIKSGINRSILWPALGSLKSKKSYFSRLNGTNKGLLDIKYDEWDTEVGSTEPTIDKISRATQEYLSQPRVEDKLRHIAKYLVKTRINRLKENQKFLQSKWQRPL